MVLQPRMHSREPSQEVDGEHRRDGEAAKLIERSEAMRL
jgi:hypothetical protein